MKVRTICTALVLIAAISTMSPVHAQQIGFRVGIAPAPVQAFISSPVQPFISSPVQGFISSPVQGFISSPVQPFISSPVTSFALTPIIMSPAPSTFAGPPHFQTGPMAPQSRPFAIQSAPISPNRGVVVIAPGSTVYAPGATVVAGGNNVIVTSSAGIGIPYATIGQGGYIYPGSVGAPGIYVNNNGQGMRGSNVVLPAAGMPRSQVIAQFGSPLVSILTMNGETMHFSGGITIILQNGLVVRP